MSNIKIILITLLFVGLFTSCDNNNDFNRRANYYVGNWTLSGLWFDSYDGRIEITHGGFSSNGRIGALAFLDSIGMQYQDFNIYRRNGKYYISSKFKYPNWIEQESSFDVNPATPTDMIKGDAGYIFYNSITYKTYLVHSNATGKTYWFNDFPVDVLLIDDYGFPVYFETVTFGRSTKDFSFLLSTPEGKFIF